MDLTFVLSKYTQLSLFPLLLKSFILELFMQITVRLYNLYEDKTTPFSSLYSPMTCKTAYGLFKDILFPWLFIYFLIARANTEGRSEDKGLKIEQEKEERISQLS